MHRYTKLNHGAEDVGGSLEILPKSHRPDVGKAYGLSHLAEVNRYTEGSLKSSAWEQVVLKSGEAVCFNVACVHNPICTHEGLRIPETPDSPASPARLHLILGFRRS